MVKCNGKGKERCIGIAWMQMVECNGKEKERCIGCLDANGEMYWQRKGKMYWMLRCKW
jgi:hypothetical protein